jgi:hypothetical protein
MYAVAGESLGVLPSEARGDARWAVDVGEELAGARAVGEQEGVVEPELRWG